MTTFPEARAKKAERLRREHRLYKGDDLGTPCKVCKIPMVRALVAAGDTTHPSCDLTTSQLARGAW